MNMQKIYSLETSFNSLFKNALLFEDEKYFDINYIPDEILHRNNEFEQLTLFFSSLINNNHIVINQFIIGKTGVGKTTIVKYFCNDLIQFALKYGGKICYIYINCRKERTSYRILITILRHFKRNFPCRGYSFQDLINILRDTLNLKKTHLILILDEVEVLLKSNDELIYTLVKLNDEEMNAIQRLSIIAILTDNESLFSLNKDILYYFTPSVIELKPYTEEQIFDILKDRAKKGLKKGVLSNELLKNIVKMVKVHGDIRYGIKLIWTSTKYAESQNLERITEDCIFLAKNKMLSNINLDLLDSIESHKLILAISILNVLQKLNKSFAPISEIQDEYSLLCKEYNLPTRSYSQIMNYIKELENNKIISKKIQSKNIIGRQAHISIKNHSTLGLKKLLISILKKRGVIQ